MGLAPSEFWSLRYIEIRLLLEGWRDRRREDLKLRRELAAWQIQWSLLPHTGKDADPITVDQLLGRKPRTPRRRFTSPAEAADAFFAARGPESQQGVKPHGQ